MGFLRRTSRAPADHDDPEVDDAMWISGAEQRYKNSVARHYGSPDTISAGGDERLRADDPACALFFYQKAIDALHSIYVGGVGDPGGWSRRPSSDDAVIVDNYLQT